MNITTLNKVMQYVIEARLTPFLWGYHGKGKSETMENYYRSRGWLVFNFRLNTMSDVGDLLGLQDFVTDSKGQKVATKFCMPEWLKQAMDFVKANPGKRALIFLDELNRAATKDLIGPVFQMSLDKRLHTYDFSDLPIDIAVASNPDTGNYSVLSLDDKALLSRFCHINFNPSREEWRDWAVKDGVAGSITDFLDEQPNFLEESGLESFSISDYATPDRRKWKAVDRLMKTGISEGDAFELVTGLVGNAATAAYYKFLEKSDKPLEIEDILKYNKKTKQRVLDLVAKNRNDVIHNANKKIEDLFKGETKVTKAQGKNILTYLEDIPLSIMFSLVHIVYKDERFAQLVEDNPEQKATLTKRLYEARAAAEGSMKPKEETETPAEGE